jgi:conjugative relaxase-like TrwC/TraI family protein
MMRPNPIRACSAVTAAAYYTRYLTDAPGEVPGTWGGAQAAALGLSGEVTNDDLLALLQGLDPVSGAQLGRPFHDRHFADGRVERAVAGFDLTFSAPKSLSVLWALTQDERLVRAHDTAVAAGMRHLERYGSTTRIRTRNGRLHPDSQGLIFAAFRQTTSRADDPQLHTHVVVSGKVQTDAGEWRALDAHYLTKHARVVGAIYQSVLRTELAHELGVGWKPIVKGQAEMLGMPSELLTDFSKRSEQIEAAVAAKVAEFRGRQGRSPNEWERQAMEREAAEDTRCPKSGNGTPDLVTGWQADAAALGWDAQALLGELRAAAVEAGLEPDRVGLDGIVAELSTAGSTWNRAQVVWALCDEARPQARLDGDQWYDVIERITDDIVGRFVELDPPDTSAPCRRSDGRSMWLPPVSTHFTTDAILREEELVLTWAMDTQLEEPEPSSSVRVDDLDVLQADAAAAVAGHDRLVLVVGPAGAGKTTMLRAAVTDLAEQRRPAFGVAPSAKAARVLHGETGVPSDTLAKLLYEWNRADRPPDPRFRLPAGTTVLVDEGGMVGTPALAHLVVLADEQQWRLALVGDHHQLQAVGRGGLFHELCQTCRVHELERIHRFRQPWEAAASLQLRHGDPRALDTYIEHGRVHPGTFDEHLTTIAERWIAVTGAGGTIAVVCSTNDHADAANAAIQSARIQQGQLDTAAMVPIGGGERAAVGDVVATRRNDRNLITTDGEPIRNREPWHVTAVSPDGSLTVSALHGHGFAVLPADYTRQHLRLGYAATEHGYQGDTVTVGIELASVATTRRGLYSGATRGTDENLILVVTESDDLAEARDVLERVLASERADVPATAQRRELAQLGRAPKAARRPEPRCDVPDWFDDLRARVRHELLEAEQESAKWEAERAERARHLAEAKAAVRELARTAAPSDPRVAEARTKLREVRHSNRVDEVFDRWANPVERTTELRTLNGALDDWKRWASGNDVPEQQLATAFAALSTTSRPGCGTLAAALAPAVPNHTLGPAPLEVEL